MNFVYIRDGVEMNHKEWIKNLDADIEAVQSRCKYCNIENAVYIDVKNGRETVVNQHVYLQKKVDMVR